MIEIIDKNSPIPLYYQVKEDIVKKIKNKELKVNDRIGSENELVKTYNVSLITIRKALAELVNEGYLYRIQGKGTYVAERKVNRVLNIMSFTEETREKGFKPEIKVLELKIVEDEAIAEKLNIHKAQSIIKIKRLRLADDIPVALQTSYISQALIELESLKNKLAKEKSLYRILNDVGVEPDRAKEVYEVQKLKSEEDCQLLNLHEGDPIFFVKRNTYTKKNELFEYVETILRGDKYTIELELKK
ncbi:GntR family transcriptional regulator [Maledivibacter halophilus]|uniref:GntR family transcriptional regulator n=1 Tax=Maledivibacter halophilus TaxID=36842 RepID=A0A1T5MBZ7_9FIRM|nr:GntR family transcriptional regulator [Maledivibacter halophilus]SKC85761.1 GntR family transcriptional regulator [Maledivibacter halophilus]